MFKKILVPLDGSDKSFEALDFAYNMATHFDSQLLLLSVFKHHSFIESSLAMTKGGIEPESLEDALCGYARDIVQQAKDILKKKNFSNMKGYVKMGTAAKEILDFTDENDVDLIVISSTGHGELSGYLLGGVSHKVAGLAKCPVMVV